MGASEAIKLRDEMQRAMDSAIDEKIALKIQADERKDHSQTLQLENVNIRKQLQENDDELRRQKKQIKALNQKINSHESQETELSKHRQDSEFYKAQLNL